MYYGFNRNLITNQYFFHSFQTESGNHSSSWHRQQHGVGVRWAESWVASTAPMELDTTTAGTTIQEPMPTLSDLLKQARANALLDARAKAKMDKFPSQKGKK